MAHNQKAMVAAHKAGLQLAHNGESRAYVNDVARTLNVDEADALLAGYYRGVRERSQINSGIYRGRAHSMFVIINPDGLYWSNNDGWTDLQSADTFTAAERDTLRLPLGGVWTILP